MRVLDLFSGIGGFSLGLERAGMHTVAFCEIDPYCRAVLRKHWPTVPCFSDVRDLHAFDVGPVDVIAGGFPCQDISTAGKGAGLAGTRSGLWSEYRRLIEECRPRFAIIENVSALRSRGLDQVLGEISAIGYDAEWHCIPASAVGAPHQRDRIWIVAHPNRVGTQIPIAGEQPAEQLPGGAGADWTDTFMAHAFGDYDRWSDGPWRWSWKQGQAAKGWLGEDGYWCVEPDVGRVADGVPNRTHRLRALGNAVVPQIPEIIGRAIMSAERLGCSLPAATVRSPAD